MVLRVQTEPMAQREQREPKGPLVQPDQPDHKVQLAQREQLDLQVQMVHKAQLVHKGLLELTAHKEQLGHRDPGEQMEQAWL